MKCSASVTFEFDTAPPVTVKSAGEGGAPHVVSSPAVKLATASGIPRGWRSIVVVLEREVDQ